MKQVFVMIVVLFSVWSAQARSILPSILSVHEVHTGLRPTEQGGFRGPISIIRGTWGRVEVLIDNNVCSAEGICTLMAPFRYEGELHLLLQNSIYEKFLVRVIHSQTAAVVQEYTLFVYFNSSRAVLKSGDQELEATNYIWVMKQDGGIACYAEGLKPYEMASELSGAGIEVRRMSKASTGAIVPSVCGIPTTSTNAYLIPFTDMAVAEKLGFTHMDAYPYAFFADEH